MGKYTATALPATVVAEFADGAVAVYFRYSPITVRAVAVFSLVAAGAIYIQPEFLSVFSAMVYGLSAMAE